MYRKAVSAIANTNALFLFAAQVVEIAASVLLIPLMVRVLGVADYGIYVSVYALINILAVIGHLGTHRLLIRDLARFPRLSRILVQQNMILKLGALPVLAVLIVLTMIALQQSPVYVICTLICIIEITLRLLASSLNAILRAQRKGWVEFGITLVDRTWSLVGSIVALQSAQGSAALIGVFIAFASAAVVRLGLSLLAGLLLWRHSLPAKPIPRMGIIKYSVYRSRRIFLSEIVGQVSDEFPLLTVNQTLPLADVGQFGVAVKALRFLYMLGMAITSNWFPVLSRGYMTLKADDYRSLIRQHILIMTAGSMLLALGMFIAAPWLIEAVAGAALPAATLALRLLCLSVTPVWLNAYAQIVLQSGGHQDRQLKPALVGAIITCVGVVVAAVNHNLAGVCIAMLIGDVAALLLNYTAIRRSTGYAF
jgi:O-antigen/teichoic acid export membrane protein